MIRWCAYCQKYLGEDPPFEDAQVSHGICRSCLDADILEDGNAAQRIRPIAEYFGRVAQAAQRKGSPIELLEEGLELGLDPWDLLIGIIQPALYEMGVKWAGATATVAEEHSLSAACQGIISLLNERQSGFQALRQSQAPEVFIVNAEGNFHILGIQMVEFFLLTRGIPVMAIYPGLPTREVIGIVQSLHPRKLGISCALPEHIESARQISGAVASLPDGERPEVFVGGFALREIRGAHPEWPFHVCLTAADILGVPPGAVA
jgi:methanogenic corrinoid protein MtbC1